ncbi:MAG TPA: transglutaminase-like domain-containing protein [Terriglobia bacterium]|nr:transglutaminase-like domain-containing protein [Terriglobia bacterium]
MTHRKTPQVPPEVEDTRIGANGSAKHTFSQFDPIRKFRELTDRPAVEIDLAEAALAIAATEYPGLDPAPSISFLDRLADRVEAGPTLSALANIAAINKVLFEEENFAGNAGEYDDPRNSYLNDVIQRKTGIPITLSLVYTEVARRKGVPLEGVGFPGHFLVKHPGPPAEILIDPFHRGAVLAPADCLALLKKNFGPEAELKSEYFASSTKKQILARMLNNLKGSFHRRGNYSKVLTMIELSLATREDVLTDVRDRGMVYFAMRRYSDSARELKVYLKLAGGDDPEVEEVLQMLGRLKGMMN